uniref:Uncharacterized protein n=1 Tax=Physcomitrium patens TaxID=3218 RepID=A0A2K1J8H8_PHYPA|nr:hypothetical protein PHYPA_020940 [Physcomitrium patens]
MQNIRSNKLKVATCIIHSMDIHNLNLTFFESFLYGSF